MTWPIHIIKALAILSPCTSVRFVGVTIMEDTRNLVVIQGALTTYIRLNLL